MKLLSWNCRGVDSPSIVPQVKELLRLFKPELTFLCETKRRGNFVSNVCKKLGWADRWHAIGKGRGILLGWGKR